MNFSKKILLLGIVTVSIHVNAQKDTVDSLKEVLKNSITISDRLSTMNILAIAWRNRRIDSAFVASDKVIQMAIQYKDTLQLATAIFYRARMLSMTGGHDRILEAHEECGKAITLLKSKRFEVLRKWINAFANGLIIRTDQYTNFRVLTNRNFRRLQDIYMNSITECLDYYASREEWYSAALLQEEFIEQDNRGRYNPMSSKDRLIWMQRAIDFYNRGHFAEGIPKVKRFVAYLFDHGMHDRAKAEPYYRSAYSLAKLQGNKFETAMNLNGIAYCHLARNEFDSALYRAKQAMTIARQMNDVSLLLRFQQPFYDTYLSMKQGDKAIPFIERYLSLKDSLLGSVAIRAISEIETHKEIIDKEQEVASLQFNALRSREEKKTLIIFTVGIIIIGLFIYYYRSRYQRKIKAIEIQYKLREEKTRIAQELHDSLGSQLSSISMALNRQASHPTEIDSQFVQNLADQALVELRNTLWVMDKPFITMEELEQRINSLFWQYRKIETPIDFKVNVEDKLVAVQLPSSKAGHLYRIIQEALHNCVRHSQATHFQACFKNEPSGIKLAISDNGIGYNSQLIKKGQHHGLKNMQARAEQMNAELTFETNTGEGVKIVLVFPTK